MYPICYADNQIKNQIFERKMGFSEIKRALKCFTVCCMPCPVRLSEGIKGENYPYKRRKLPVDKSLQKEKFTL
jgi:hypothetical protein